MYATLFKPRILVPSYNLSLNLTCIQVSKYPENLTLVVWAGSLQFRLGPSSIIGLRQIQKRIKFDGNSYEWRDW